MARNYHEGRRKLIFGKPVWEVRMEMRALTQKFDISNEVCRELVQQMQAISLDKNEGAKYRIGAFNAIVGAMRLDQQAAIAVMKYHTEMAKSVPDDQLDSVIDSELPAGELADMADSPEAPPLGADSGAEGPGRAEADADDADDPPAGLS